MTDSFFILTILSARYSQDEYTDWMKILVFLVFVVGWIISGIAKARSGKIKDSGLDEARKGQQKPRFQQKWPIGPHQIKTKTAIDAKVAVLPSLKPDFKEQIESVSKDKLNDKSVPPGLPDEKTKIAAAPSWYLLNLDDYDELRRAILYYEIMGKPVSLRHLDA